MNKKGKKTLITSLIFSVLAIIFLTSYFVLAADVYPTLLDQKVKIEYGREIVENGGVEISAKVVEHCYYKPDGKNDGYKICEAVIEGYNPYNYTLIVDKPSNGFSSYFMLDKSLQVKGKKYEYYFSHQFELYNETIQNITEIKKEVNFGNDEGYKYRDGIAIAKKEINDTGFNMTSFNITYYTIERKRFVNWTLLSKDCKDTPTNNYTHFAYKVKFEFPQYASASYNFSINYKKQDSTSIPIFLDPDVSACGTLSTAGATYTQTANIVPTADVGCIIISAENITYDGNGYYIANSTINRTGIYSTKFNTTIKNTNISMSSSIGGIGIDLTIADNSNIINNTLNKGFIGIYVIAANYVTIENNTAHHNDWGIYLTIASDYNNVTNNTANNNTWQGISILTLSDYNIIKDNTVENNSNMGIVIQDDCNHNIIDNNVANFNYDGITLFLDANYNNVTNNTANNNTYQGIRIDGSTESSNYNIIDNNIVNLNRRGIRLYRSANYNTITNNTANNNTCEGIRLGSNSSNNSILDNSIDYNGPSISGGSGILVFDGSNDNNFTNNLINNSKTDGFRLRAQGNRVINNTIINSQDDGILSSILSINTVINTTISNSGLSGVGKDITLHPAEGTINNTFLNCSYSTIRFIVNGTAELTRKWYFRLNVTLENSFTGEKLLDKYNPTLVIYDSVSNVIVTNITQNGTTLFSEELTEYVNSDGTKTYYTSHSIQGSADFYNTNHSTYYNLTTLNNVDDNTTILMEPSRQSPEDVSTPTPVPSLFVETIIETFIYENKTYCGDGICQPEGNDLGIKESWFNCNQDCEPFDLDSFVYGLTKYCWDGDPSTVCFYTQMLFGAIPIGEEISDVLCGNGICEPSENIWSCSEDCGELNMDILLTYCFDDDENTPCFWSTNISYIILFGFGTFTLAFLMLRIRIPGVIEKTTPLKYIQLKLKKRKR